ncbi:MAG: AMP-binding protein [Verrucomicrobiales bacterium]|nr:AMP-binding protein [Verrucomicrobiales bacterium]
MNLYQRWQHITAQFSQQHALLDWKSGQSWTFAQIQAKLDRRPCLKPRSLVHPNGWQVELIFDTLQAWRDDAILCPVENDPPDRQVFGGIAANIVHVKITSGSTAAPKLILFTAEQLAADAANIVSTMSLNPQSPNLGVISMAHSYGFSNLVAPLLLHGIPLVWAGSPLPDLLKTIVQQNPQAYTLPAVPAMWRAWLQADALTASNIQLAISAGAPLSLELEQRLLEEKGIKVHNFYGSSECGGIAYDRSMTCRSDAAYVGTAMDRVELRSDPQNHCLAVTSDAVGETYWPAQSEESSLYGRSFVTSDRVDIDPTDNQIFLRDRHSDTINIAGRKVAPGKIEAAIGTAFPEIEHCLVFAVPSKDLERVEEVVACISNDQIKQAQIKAEITGKLSNFEIPRHWWFCPDLKPDSRGKISRRAWREKYLFTKDDLGGAS